MALVVRRTAAAGGADATFNSAATAWAAIDALLIAAGWTVLHDYSSGVLSWVASTGPVPGPQVDVSYNVGDVVEVNSNRYQCIQSGATAFSPATGPTGTGQSANLGAFDHRATDHHPDRAQRATADQDPGAQGHSDHTGSEGYFQR